MARFDPTSTASGGELLPRAGDAEATIHVPISAAFYEAAIEGLTRLDAEMLQVADFPPIYESGVGYRKEAEDTWRHADDVLCSGWGDCEDLAAWRAAELRVSGEDPDARVYVYRSGPRRFHAVVARGDGRLEDPSVLLGMRVSEARRRQLPRWEGQVEMSDTQPRTFATCQSCSGCSKNGGVNGAGEDILSRGTIGTVECPVSGDGTAGWFSSIRNAAKNVGRAAGKTTRAFVPPFPRLQTVARFPAAARSFVSGEGGGGGGDDGGVGAVDWAAANDQMMLGEDEGSGADDGADGPGAYDDGGSYDDSGYADSSYPDEYAYADDSGYQDQSYQEPVYEEPAYQEPAPPPGPNPVEQAMAATGRGIKSAASSAWDTTKDVFSPIKYAVQTATAPIKTVAKGSQLVHKYATAPFKALNKVFSFLGGVDEVMPEQVGYVDDDEYEPGDEEFWDDGSSQSDDYEEVAAYAPDSQKPRFRTAQLGPGVWQGQVTLPSKEAGKAVTLTTTPAPDEGSAMDRMYNLSLSAANSPAMMALMNPLAFTTLMLMKGVGKSGGVFKSIGSGVATAAKAVGRGAESIARTATEW